MLIAYYILLSTFCISGDLWALNGIWSTRPRLGWTPAVSASDTTSSSHAPPPPGQTRPFLSAADEFGDVSRGAPSHGTV
jgi:hypothetical protein